MNFKIWWETRLRNSTFKKISSFNKIYILWIKKIRSVKNFRQDKFCVAKKLAENKYVFTISAYICIWHLFLCYIYNIIMQCNYMFVYKLMLDISFTYHNILALLPQLYLHMSVYLSPEPLFCVYESELNFG